MDSLIQLWCVCRLEAWFGADADEISLKNWDQESVLTGGHGLMVNGYYPVIEALAQGLDIRLNQREFLVGEQSTSRVTKITRQYNGVRSLLKMHGTSYFADAYIISVPLVCSRRT